MRSSIMDIGRPDEMARFRALLRDADVFFANRRSGFIERMGLSTDELAVVRPGIVHVDISIDGPKGPWANQSASIRPRAGYPACWHLRDRWKIRNCPRSSW